VGWGQSITGPNGTCGHVGLTHDDRRYLSYYVAGYRMQAQTRVDPWWAALTVWGVVNAINMLQAVGFLSRVYTGSREINHLLGLVIIALAVPAAVALVAFVRARAGWRQWIGPAVYLAFVALEVVVDYVWLVEFRSPMRYGILVPYLLLFFGAILLMGLPMFRLNRRLWLVTVATTLLLLGSMGVAMYAGVG
jgi:hypothetical protein